MSNSLCVIDLQGQPVHSAGVLRGLEGIADHRPQFALQEFQGVANLPGGGFDRASLEVTVGLRALSIKDEVSDSDRRTIERAMFEEILEVESFPEAVFESTHLDAVKVADNTHRLTVTGHLTLHGVRNQHSMEARIVGGGDSFRAYGEFKVPQGRYGLKIASVAGGIVRIKDELKFSFYAVARAGEPTAITK